MEEKSDYAKIAALALTALALGGALFGLGVVWSPKQSLVAGFQGMQNGIYGYQPNGQAVSTVGNPLATPSGACSYTWNGAPTVSYADVRATAPTGFPPGCFYGNTGTSDLTINAQTNVVPYNQPLSAPIQVNYYVCAPNTGCAQKQHVMGQVQVYRYTIVLTGSGGVWEYPGDTVWLNLASQTWNQLTTDPVTGVSGNAFESPLYAFVSSSSWSQQGNSQVPLAASGSALTFYTSPSTTGSTLASLTNGGSPSSAINSTLSSVYAPDSRLQRFVYYPVSISNFQASCPLGSCSLLGNTPVQLTLTIQLYTLQIGEYLLTNPSTTGQGPPSAPCQGFACIQAYANSFGQWLTNPLNQLLTGLGILGFSGVAILVILAIFATPLFIAIFLYYTRRKDNG